MIVEVFSIHAAVGGLAHGTTWRGELDLDDQATVEDQLERVFRLLNDVDPGDRPRMLGFGYALPSLSVGDFVTLHLPKGLLTYRVSLAGFEPVTGAIDLLINR